MSPPTNTQRDTARNLFQPKGLVRMRDLRGAGVGPETIARLVREGTVMRVARGLYQLADYIPVPGAASRRLQLSCPEA